MRAKSWGCFYMPMEKRRKWPNSAKRTTFGNLTRSELMSRIHSQGNRTTEVKLARLLRTANLIGWRRKVAMFGKPDFIWPDKKLAVFVDGCFWHGHACGRNLIPHQNRKAWESKISGNQRRDRRVSRFLRKEGWKVIRIWECILAKFPDMCQRRIQRSWSRPTIKIKGPLGSHPNL